MALTLLVVIAGFGIWSNAGVAATDEPSLSMTPRFVSGTIERIDPQGPTLTLRTNNGQMKTWPLENTNALDGLAKGDLVNVELDEEGRVLNIVKVQQERIDPSKG
ncbi:MAG: hypothetical protein ACREI3_12485 [Nitrospirales bacterium]